MNLQDQVLYRCIHASCARLLPRKVNYCPYCGVSQRDGSRAPAPTVAPTAAIAPAAVVIDKADAAPPPPPQAPPPVPPAQAASPAPVPPQAAPPRGPAPPPRREPIRMRWWLLALAALWAIWMITKPDKQKIEQRIVDATVLAKECKLGEAQGELIALRSGKASDEQLTRLQKAINDASPGCEKKRIRARAWLDARQAVEKLLDDGENARALARLSQFTRRHGEDAETRALKARIGPVRQPEQAAPRVEARVEAQSGALAREVISARRLIDQAERDIKVGNYQAASNKMAYCITTVAGGSRECAAFKVYADRLHQDLRRCLASGMEWIDHHCQ